MVHTFGAAAHPCSHPRSLYKVPALPPSPPLFVLPAVGHYERHLHQCTCECVHQVCELCKPRASTVRFGEYTPPITRQSHTLFSPSTWSQAIVCTLLTTWRVYVCLHIHYVACLVCCRACVYTCYCIAARPKWVPLDAKHSPCAPQLPSIPLAPPSVATAAVTPLLQPTATRRRCQPLEDSQYHDVAPHVWHLFVFLSARWLQQCGVSWHSTNTTRSPITFAVTVCCCCYWCAACATFGRARRNGGKSSYTTPGPNAYNSGGTFGSRPHSASSSRLRRSPS